MKNAIYLLGVLFLSGTAAAQDSTYTKTVTTTKKTERVFKMKRHAPVIPVTTEKPFHSVDSVYIGPEPVRREEEYKKATVAPVKQ